MTFIDASIQGVRHQPDAYLSQANPVTATWYTVLDTTLSVRLISVTALVTWAVTQPNPLYVRITIDGNVLTFIKPNPVATTYYTCNVREADQEISQTMNSMDDGAIGGPVSRAFLMEGRSVKVEVMVVWATTQPTPLICRVKWAKR